VVEYLNSASEFSTHYAVGLDGSVDCFIDPLDRAWSNGILEPGNGWTGLAELCGADAALNPNHLTITCDTRDGGCPEADVSDEQFAGVLFAAREAQARFPNSIRYLVRHADISPQSRARCPGERWLASGRFHALAAALGWRTVV
jgi:N-acetyl-anhydromuramyl-L-alanine amidase AmpD